jgi:hypothetical protein
MIETYRDRPPHVSQDEGREAFQGVGAGCPECGARRGPIHFGRDYWFACDEHRVLWCLGTGLTDGWKAVTDDMRHTAVAETRDYRLWPDDPLTASEKAAHSRLEVLRHT